MPTTPYKDILATAQTWCEARVSARERPRVLDAGSGLRAYVEFPPHVHVTGVDVSRELLDANPRLDERIQADLQELDVPDLTYDCIICWDVLEHLEDPTPVVEKLARGVAYDGIFIVGSPDPLSIKGLVTRFTPYAFHLWFYRRYVDAQATDAPGAGPYPTFMKRGGGPRAVREAAERMGLTVAYNASVEGPLQIALRERYRITGVVWRFARVLTHIVSLGRIRADTTDFLYIFQRETAPAAADSLPPPRRSP